MIIKILLCIAVIYTADAFPLEPENKCNLEQSELGPDWYKVQRPPLNGKSSERSYMHMPCAPTTVFNAGICSCTNLATYLFESVKRGSRDPTARRDRISKHDAVKVWEGGKPDRPNTGSLLLNMRTGEIKNCPFRASSRGRRWYMIREYGDHWATMKCAEGTVYNTIKCTCVHKSTETRNPEDEDVLVIQGDTTDLKKDNLISRRLNISDTDIDFTVDKDIPFGRRHDQSKSGKESGVKSRFSGKADVKVTFDEKHTIPDKELNRIFDTDSKDVISEEHRSLVKPGPIISSSSKSSSMSIDRERPLSTFTTDTVAQSGIIKHTQISENKQVRDIKKETPTRLVEDTRDTIQVIDKINSQIISLINVGSDDLIYDDTSIDIPAFDDTAVVNEVEAEVVANADKIKGDMEPDIYDEIFYQEECSKTPIPELGPQYFLYYVIDLGFVPYTCHGNMIYDDSMCACIPSPEDTAFDEVNVPGEVCYKRPIPEMGPQFFEDFLFGIGYIPFVCHGDKLYDHAECACV